MSNPNALFLLADHIKLSLLERKRAQALNLQSDSQDGHISRSLEQFRDGLESLQAEQKRLEEAGEDTYGGLPFLPSRMAGLLCPSSMPRRWLMMMMNY